MSSDPTPTPPPPGAPPRLVGRRSHREPRYAAFISLGVVLGVVAAAVLTFARPEGSYSYGSVLGYLAVALGLVGGIVGGTVAAVIGFVTDRRHRSG